MKMTTNRMMMQLIQVGIKKLFIAEIKLFGLGLKFEVLMRKGWREAKWR